MKELKELNKHAQALGRLRRGIKEIPSATKRANAISNLIGARLKRWPAKIETKEPNE